MPFDLLFSLFMARLNVCIFYGFCWDIESLKKRNNYSEVNAIYTYIHTYIYNIYNIYIYA